MSRNSHEPLAAPSLPSQADIPITYSSLPSPPQTPGGRGTRKGSFSFGSPFALLGGSKHKGEKARKMSIGEAILEGEEDASGARRKRLPSGGIVLIKGPFSQSEYLPFTPPEDVPSLPPLPPNLAQLKAATIHKIPSSSQHRRSLSGFRSAQIGNALNSLLSVDPSPEALLSKSLPEECSLLAAAPLDFAPLTLPPLPNAGRSRSGSLAVPAGSTAHMYAPPRASMGARRPSVGTSPPPRPLPPPPHLGLGSLSRLNKKPRPLSKSNPNTPAHEIPDPFSGVSLIQTLGNVPKPTPKGPAIRAVERADARLSMSSEAPRLSGETVKLSMESPLARLPSIILKEVEPLRISPRTSPQTGLFDLPPRKDLKITELPLKTLAPVLKAEAKPKSNLPDRPSTSPSVSQSPPITEKEKKIRSVLGLTFPHPPTPLLSYATANSGLRKEGANPPACKAKDLNDDSPIIVPDLPKTPPMQQRVNHSPRSSPERTVKPKRSLILSRVDSWKQHKRKRSQSIAGSPTTSWPATGDAPALPPLPVSPNKDKDRYDRQWEAPISPISPTLSPRAYALAHAQAHNEAQAQAMRALGGPSPTPMSSPAAKMTTSSSMRVGELEEENKLLREALKAHREKLHVALRQSTDRAPHSNTHSSGPTQLLQPAHIIEGPPPVPLPPTPASPMNMLAVPASPSRHHEHHYPMVRSTGSSASIASLVTASSTSSFSNSRAETPLTSSRRETGTLFAEIASLQTQLAQAQGEIEVYKLLTTNTSHTRSPGDDLKNAMKKCRSEPMLLGTVGLGIEGFDGESADDAEVRN
ncbi:hypothetical protein DACRYDRAFT_108014 [Dacryopinax primogenitus]|uniref:Uncharacterized protein n=1 Tax=Dacryopinax primogenitus (strain DJM 731) TaxID=1858805 RepID=M5FZZ0_DACPD|nr:uncharacterized protein DACRYDRAFT_108014 [Dacryopinax primogenitus]EJU01465.1 hypothetical protein DACRYDRAFT_108014 [Dacryopinax primogenitus]